MLGLLFFDSDFRVQSIPRAAHFGAARGASDGLRFAQKAPPTPRSRGINVDVDVFTYTLFSKMPYFFFILPSFSRNGLASIKRNTTFETA